jgi:hypothetical protein
MAAPQQAEFRLNRTGPEALLYRPTLRGPAPMTAERYVSTGPIREAVKGRETKLVVQL